MNERMISVLRKARTALQVAAEPIDLSARILNKKRGYPPLWIRQKAGDLNDFDGSGGEYMAYLKLLCGLKPGDNLLDLGCGCGLMALPVTESPTLPEYIHPGRYLGLDTDRGLIGWCERNINYKNCDFQWLPNNRYFINLWTPEPTCDVVLAKSLFTHLLWEEAEGYLRTIAKILKPGGVCLSTWFILDGSTPTGRYTFPVRDGGPVCYERASRPRLAVGYDWRFLMMGIGETGLGVETIKYGTWPGRRDGLSFQDIIILKKAKV